MIAGIILMVLMCLWLIALVYLGASALDADDWRSTALYGIAAILMVSIPVGSFIGLSEKDDPHATTLCLSGHQEWRQTYRPPMLIGKVMMPGHTTMKKVWICDQWEAK